MLSIGLWEILSCPLPEHRATGRGGGGNLILGKVRSPTLADSPKSLQLTADLMRNKKYNNISVNSYIRVHDNSNFIEHQFGLTGVSKHSAKFLCLDVQENDTNCSVCVSNVLGIV